MLALVVPVFTGCSSDKTLNLLNWGDYLEPSLKDEFKRRTGITIKEKVVTSNEEMMIQLQADDCPYDLCIPSDYAIERMIGEGRLAKIDCSSLKKTTRTSVRHTATLHMTRRMSIRFRIHGEFSAFCITKRWLMKRTSGTGMFFGMKSILRKYTCTTAFATQWRQHLFTAATISTPTMRTK